MAYPRDVLIAEVKLSARNLMRNDPRVWFEALDAALTRVLPPFWDAALRSVENDDRWRLTTVGFTRNQAMQVAGALVYAAMEQADRGADEPINFNRIVAMALRTTDEVSKEM